MNLILLAENDFQTGNDRVILRGRRLEHVRKVHKAAIDEELCVGLLNGKIGTGKVLSINDSGLEMAVSLTENPPAEIPLTVVLALPRPKMLKRIITAISSLGVKKIHLINAYRVEKSYWQSPLLQPDQLNQYVFLGLEQARDTVLPSISRHPLFKPYVEDELPAMMQGSLALVAHPTADVPCPHHVRQPVTVAIGPEGGFIQYEVDKFIACGFTAVHLGERILRVETAVTAMIAKLF